LKWVLDENLTPLDVAYDLAIAALVLGALEPWIVPTLEHYATRRERLEDESERRMKGLLRDVAKLGEESNRIEEKIKKALLDADIVSTRIFSKQGLDEIQKVSEYQTPVINQLKLVVPAAYGEAIAEAEAIAQDRLHKQSPEDVRGVAEHIVAELMRSREEKLVKPNE